MPDGAFERLLITGATGFVGSAVLRQLAAGEYLLGAVASGGRTAAAPPAVRLLARSIPADRSAAPAGEWRAADLDDPASLRGCCDGVDTVLHLASRIGGDRELCRRTNVLGTEALLAEAGRAGVRRIVYLSTAAVYGDGPHRGQAERGLVPCPVSATSSTRLAAEAPVLARGGTVVRPHLVHGPGDRWVLPGIVDLVRRVRAWPEGGRARTSMIAVEDLGRALLALALAPDAPAAGEVLHAVHPEPVRVRELISQVCSMLGVPLPEVELTEAQLQAALTATGSSPGDRRPALLCRDRWYDGTELWRRTGLTPGPGFAARLAEHAAGYRAEPQVLPG